MSDATSAPQPDAAQYSVDSIRDYEAVYGEDFVSPGGETMARELVDRLALPGGARVLDAGCGLGGAAFLMARERGWIVDGIDLSRNMLAAAATKLETHGLGERVFFDRADLVTLDRPSRYDAVYSRDVFLHIHDKARLFAALHASLRTGGVLLFTDYCCGERPWHPDFTDYVRRRGYCLHTPGEYRALVAAAGFVDVVAEDVTERFITILEDDLRRIETMDLAAPARARLVEGWRDKLERATAGDHRWVLVEASRADPMHA